MRAFARFGILIPLLIADMAAAEPPGPATVDFNRDVRPILSSHCFECHGNDAASRQADLRLDDEQDAKRDRGGYRIIAAGHAEQSELIARITSADESLRMPPADSGKPLTAKEIDVLRRWIAQGAAWAKPWAYEMPVRAAVPDVRDMHWPAHWIDRFLLARMEQEGVRPSPDADAVTLLRRLSFDLTGLPPTPDEVEAILRDPSPQKWERAIERLLASEAYGERTAIDWLDLVRFADTVGYHGDQDHNISPYRDWVIDALNANMPFDQFTREQLAGDLLPNATVDQRIASGYNRLLQTSHEGGVQEKEYLAIYAADRIRNLSAVWMGATVGCAQCHDHKFDPYTARDFYSLAAFFADVDEVQHLRRGADRIPTMRAPEIAVHSARERTRLAWLDAEIARLNAAIDAAKDPQSVAEETERLAALEKEHEALLGSMRQTMITVSVEPRPVRILPRGNWLDDSGPLVEPAVPAFLGKLDVERRRANRLDLANWLTDPRDGVGLLTARVVVNRLWARFFGQGLSRSLDDFGGQGEAPSHPELLDRLAHEFVDSGWDVKHMVRLLVTSRAYRQASMVSPEFRQRNPENRLFARQARFRLPAEIIRDNALAVSGLLVRKVGGASVKPYQPDGYYRHLNFPKRTYEAHLDARQWRRGVYMHWQRQYLHPMLKAFDAPSREECTAGRPQSNTPLASLVLLNDPTFVEAARVFAARILQEGGSTDDARLTFAYRQALSRPPRDGERHVLRELLDGSRANFAADPDSATRLVSVGIAPPAVGLAPAEWAAWTTVARAILNLSETNTRN